MNKRFLIYLLLFLWIPLALAEQNIYQVEISAPSELDDLLEAHLEIIKWRNNPRINPAEWQRLYSLAPQNIQNLLKTEGYFFPTITPSLTIQNGVHTAKFVVEPGTPARVDKVNIQFTGSITRQTANEIPGMHNLRSEWTLKTGEKFQQSSWSQAKRGLLTKLLVERYPNATITKSKAEVNLETRTVSLFIEIDSGEAIRFGEVSIEGLQRYQAHIVRNLNPIQPNKVFNQADLLSFQGQLQDTGYFQSVEVTADTKNTVDNIAPIKVTVVENQSARMGIGVGYSTNTGARTQLTYDELNVFNRSWRLASSLKIEQRARSLGGEIHLPTTSNGYRNSINAGVEYTLIEGQALTSSKVGVRRAWGPRKREQHIGASYLIENQDLDGGESTTKDVATLGYGITLRNTDNDLAPTRGYLFNAQFAGTPFKTLSDGVFLQSNLKAQFYYPITTSTQFIGRAEIGMVSGQDNAPEAFLFRAGGDQSIRGYAYKSLGVSKANATVGGRYLATGSVEAVQWLAEQWGIAAFVDLGNAADSFRDLEPVYGYGLGARWKSPLGPIGADIAYGEETQEYRLHFNIGVAF